VQVMPEDEPMLAVLALDGRRSIADLAQQTRWSAARVTRRLEALLGSGAIYLDVDIAHSAFGFDSPVDIWLTVEPMHLHAAGQALAQLPEIAFCAAITGTANLMAVSHFRTGDELYRFVTDRIGSLPGIRQFELSPVMQIVKQAGSFVEGGRLTGTPSVSRRTANPRRE
jgi:DNA-binding Lrp family transcriptional regulator